MNNSDCQTHCTTAARVTGDLSSIKIHICNITFSYFI